MSTRSEPVSAVLGSLVGTFSALSLGYLAVVGFTGGTVPLLGWDLPGGLLHGLAWLLVLGSAGLMVLWCLPLLAAMALQAAIFRFVPVTRAVRPVCRVANRVRPPAKQAA